MDKIFEYIPEIVSALWGLLTGILLEKVGANKEKRIDIYKLRKDLYIEITKLITNIPPSNCDIEDYKKYYQDLFDYYKKHTAELMLISNRKITKLFMNYVKLLDRYINKNKWDNQNRKVMKALVEELIYYMRTKLSSSD